MTRKRLYLVTVADDAGWLDGCPDYWSVFFGGYLPEANLIHTSKRAAERRARELRTTFDDDGAGKPFYHVVTVEDRGSIVDIDDLSTLTGWRALDDQDLESVRAAQ